MDGYDSAQSYSVLFSPWRPSGKAWRHFLFKTSLLRSQPFKEHHTGLGPDPIWPIAGRKPLLLMLELQMCLKTLLVRAWPQCWWCAQLQGRGSWAGGGAERARAGVGLVVTSTPAPYVLGSAAWHRGSLVCNLKKPIAGPVLLHPLPPRSLLWQLWCP